MHARDDETSTADMGGRAQSLRFCWALILSPRLGANDHSKRLKWLSLSRGGLSVTQIGQGDQIRKRNSRSMVWTVKSNGLSSSLLGNAAQGFG